MLHMIVNTHTEESCAFRSEEAREALLGALGRIEAAATSLGASYEGGWSNMAGHTVFVLIDAPNAHVVGEVIRESGLIGLTTSSVYTVYTLEETAERIASS